MPEASLTIPGVIGEVWGVAAKSGDLSALFGSEGLQETQAKTIPVNRKYFLKAFERIMVF